MSKLSSSAVTPYAEKDDGAPREATEAGDKGSCNATITRGQSGHFHPVPLPMKEQDDGGGESKSCVDDGSGSLHQLKRREEKGGHKIGHRLKSNTNTRRMATSVWQAEVKRR